MKDKRLREALQDTGVIRIQTNYVGLCSGTSIHRGGTLASALNRINTLESTMSLLLDHLGLEFFQPYELEESIKKKKKGKK